jgi:hypothetical protein
VLRFGFRIGWVPLLCDSFEVCLYLGLMSQANGFRRLRRLRSVKLRALRLDVRRTRILAANTFYDEKLPWS